MRDSLFGAEAERMGMARRFVAWWAGELAQLLPAYGRNLPRNAFMVALYDGSTIGFAASGRRGFEELGVIDCPTAEQELDRHAEQLVDQVRQSDLPLILRLAPSLGLETVDRLPRSAAKELRQIIANRLDGLTPWTAETAVFDTISVTPSADNTLEVALAVVPRRTVARALEALEQLGLAPDVVDLADEDGMASPTHDFAGAGRPPPLPRFVPIVAALFVFLAVAAAVFAFFDAQAREAALDQRRSYASLLEQRLEDLPLLRQRIADLESEGRAVLERHLQRPSPVLTLEILSRILPDTVWLESLTLSEGKLQLTGYSSDAAQLPSLLERHPGFGSAALTASSERLAMPRGTAGTVEVDRFTLQAEVRSAVAVGP